MINELLVIKKNRTDKQLKQVSLLEDRLWRQQKQTAENSNALADFQKWQHDESERLFAQLVGASSRLHQLEDFNTQVAEFKKKAIELNRTVIECQAAESATEEALKSAKFELQKAQRAQEKFSIFADELEQKLRKKKRLIEETLADDIAMESLTSRTGQTTQVSL